MEDNASVPSEGDSETAPAEQGQGVSQDPGADPGNNEPFVDIEDPALQARFNTVYRNMKDMERDKSKMAQLIVQLAEQVDSLRGSVEGREAAATMEKVEKAFERGDYEAGRKLLAEVTEAKAKPSSASVRKTSASAKDDSGMQAQEMGLSYEDQSAVTVWAGERDAKGELLRPWAQGGHPQARTAAIMAEGLAADPAYAGKPLKVILKAVDQAMDAMNGTVRTGTPARRVAGGAVMGTSTQRPGAKAGVQLSQEERQVAKRMGLSETDYAKAKSAAAPSTRKQ